MIFLKGLQLLEMSTIMHLWYSNNQFDKRSFLSFPNFSILNILEIHTYVHSLCIHFFIVLR